jgi:hypothetical protein
MRIGSVSFLVLSAFALAACEGTPSDGSSTSADSLDLCGLGCPFGTPATGGGNSNGANDPSDGDDSSTDGGNTTDLSPLTADTTIALESSKLVEPSGSSTSLSLLTAGTSPLTTTAQILSGTKPTKLTIQIDTNSPSNSSWPTPVEMTEYVYGSNAADPTGGNNGGAGTGYREYRAYSTEIGKERDESLQVWAWTDAYAVQYRNTPSGGEAPNQAWSFGGNKTALVDMPVAGSATYDGRFVGTAKTANYLKPSDALIDPNALWRIEGASQIVANFATAGVTGTLTPETWTSFQDGITGTYMQPIGGLYVPGNGLTATEAPNYSFYNTTVALSGTITGNTYAGTADLSGPFISGDQTMYGGFFGATGAETAGVFHVTGMDPYPVGGSAGINDDKRAYLTIQGAFHGTSP